jgi:threonine/homoserine/homoserine lactone efflux protein
MDYGAVPFLLLGCTFITTGMTWCLIVACFSAAVSEHLRRKPRTTLILRRVTGGLFVVLGLRMALTGMK